MAGDIGLPIKAAADIDTPASGKYNLFLNSADSDQLYKKSSAGVSTLVVSAGTVTSVAQSFTGGLISVAGSPVTTSGTLALTVAGTSGGVPYFSSASTWASSAALAANSIVIGGGAGVAPSTITTGTGVVTALGVNVGSAGSFIVNGGALGSPSSAGTMPAFTLGGTISGGGNQINNVIIGTSNPLAGFFTTLSGTSSITLGTASTTVGSIILHNATNANTITIQSGVTSASYSLTLPTAQGAASTVLTNNGSGVLSWAAASGGSGVGDKLFLYHNFI